MPAKTLASIASATAADSESNVRVIDLAGSDVMGAGSGTADALKTRDIWDLVRTEVLPQHFRRRRRR